MRRVLIVVAFLAVLPALAGDCPTPKPLDCKRLLTLAQQRHCLEAKTEAAAPTAAPCTSVPCTSVPCETVPCKQVDCKPVYLHAHIPTVKPHFRLAFGGDLGYGEEHRTLMGLHVGFMAPTDTRGGNLFWKIGPAYQAHPDINTTCRIGCRTCGASREGAGPWNALTSLSYVWK